MNNRMYNITKEELGSVRESLQSKAGLWLAEIDGDTVPTWTAYAQEIGRVFRFPTSCGKSMDAYLDWITDLSWLDADSYALIIHNSARFIIDEPNQREIILEDLETVVLHWWQSEVEKFVVEGKAKPFDIYLVE